MKKRMLACLFLTAVLPLMTSSTQNGSTNPVPFVSVVYAGHSLMGGGWCECGGRDCACDPDELGNHMIKSGPERNDRSSNQVASSPKTDRTSQFDFGSGALMLALAVFLWTRFRG